LELKRYKKGEKVGSNGLFLAKFICININ